MDMEARSDFDQDDIRNSEYPGFSRSVKIVIEKHPEGYMAYALGLKGMVLGQGDTYEDTITDIRAAIRAHIETYGKDAFPDNRSPILEAFIAETSVFA